MKNTIMRNATIALGAALTLLALTPAHATGICSSFPNLDRCPIYGVCDTTPYESSWQTAPRRVRHTQNRELRYLRQG